MSDQPSNTPHAPEAIMLLSSHCAFCPSVLDSLSKMIKSGELSHLSIINLEQNPDAMQKYNVRSVPWGRIGKHELSGSQTLEALQQRVQWSLDDQKSTHKNTLNSAADYDYLLSEGQVNQVISSLQDDQESIQAIMDLLGDTGTVLSTRIGIGVIFEEFAGSKLIRSLIPQLGELSKHDDSRIRADAFHYLGMTADKTAITYLEAGKDESGAEIKDIITDSLDELSNA
jgi:hypothetical protein